MCSFHYDIIAVRKNLLIILAQIHTTEVWISATSTWRPSDSSWRSSWTHLTLEFLFHLQSTLRWITCHPSIQHTIVTFLNVRGGTCVWVVFVPFTNTAAGNWVAFHLNTELCVEFSGIKRLTEFVWSSSLTRPCFYWVNVELDLKVYV